jgi:tetratricopeptide (TPR) repeat protein
MRAIMWPLLLILTPVLYAQDQPPPDPLVPVVAVDPSRLPKPGDTVATRELLIPPKAIKELQRSRTALQSGDIRSSAQHLEKALHIYPYYLEAHNNLGSRYIDLHEYEKAAAEFQKAIGLDSRILQPVSNLSVALFLLQRYPDAEVAARRALELDPHNSTAQYMLGCILATEKRDASEAMELLHRTEAEFPDARLLVAQILVRQGSFEEAKKELHSYLRVPGIEKKQKVECWLARLEQTLPPSACAQASSR